MGDVLHALPAVLGLRAAIPGCTIGWAIEPGWLPLLIGSHGPGPTVDRVHPVPARKWQKHPFTFTTAAEIAALRRELRAARYHLCIDLQGSLKSAIVGRLAGAPSFTGMDHPREQAARRLYSNRVSCVTRHVVEQACELVTAAVGQSICPAVVQLPTDADAEGWCTAALIRAGISERFVLLAPEAGWGAKQWGESRYTQLAIRLRQAGFGVIINAPAGTPGPHLANTIADAAGVHGLSSTVAQLIALTRRAALVIGGDTGPVHLAAALGRPVVALFGPTDPNRNGPRFPGSRVRVLRHQASVTSHKRVTATEPGLARITVEEVEQAARELLDTAPEANREPARKDANHG